VAVLDPVRVVWNDVGVDPSATPFSHVHAPNSALYRDVMGAFRRAKERFVVHLRPEDLVASLSPAPDPDTLAVALTRLVEWGNLRADPDTGRVTSVEDFHRARFLYQLSVEGEAAEQALAVFERVMSRRAVLQSVALTDIAAQLRALLAVAEEAAWAGIVPDPAKAHLLLLSVTERFVGLADNAQAFMASLRRTVDLADAGVEEFLEYKERLIAYLQRFVADLANQTGQIATLTLALDEAGVVPLLGAAARRDAEDAAPGQDETDDAVTQAYVDALHRWTERWNGLRSWFVSGGVRRHSQAQLLRSAAISAITQIIDAARAINERRSGRSDRSADFRTLARWFAEAPDDPSRHRLWQAAFGLGSARHLSVSTETLQAWSADPPAPSTPWSAAPPVEISPQLRRTGSYERRGQPNRIQDRSTARRLLTERAEQESAQLASARARLATTVPTFLSSFQHLDTKEFRLLLAVLGAALAARAPGEEHVTTSSSDGTMLVRLSVLPDMPPVELHTLDGVLRGPEHLVEIVDLTVVDATVTSGVR
jgi:uncharacterized protein (TIGR02677 family)